MNLTQELAAPTPLLKPSAADDLRFRCSPQTSLGVELELQILDRDTGDLALGALPLLKACAEENVDGVTAELLQSMIEIRTGVCRNVSDVRDQTAATLRRVLNIAGSLGYELAMAGTHPFHRKSTNAVFPAARYERIMERLAWLTYQRVVFGMHVHVGVPSGDEAIGAINMLVQYLPHLLALSANSPFWQGEDTGLQSCRTVLYRMLPHAGVPRYFARWKDFRNFYQVMRGCNAMQSLKDIYWDIRPRPDLGTIEFRICDMPPTLAAVLGLTTLIRCLVINCLRLQEERPRMRRGDMRRHWIAVENKWLAARYGLDGMCIRTPGGKKRRLRHDVSDLIERLTPIARETGDHVFLAGLQPIVQGASGADEQRQLIRETGNWKTVTDVLTRRLVDELGATRWR